MEGKKKYYLPVVVKLRMTGGVVKQGCDCYIGRRMAPRSPGNWDLPASEWKNPFTVKKYGDNAIPMYEARIRQEIAQDPSKWYYYLVSMVSQNKPIILGCWCKGDKKGNYKPEIPCHGDIIVKLCSEVIQSLEQL